MMDLHNYRFRCSSLGKIASSAKPNLTVKQTELLQALLDKQSDKGLTTKQTVQLGSLLEKRDAKPKLLATAKSYLDQVVQEEIFGRSHDIKSKYLDKGIIAEESSLSLYTNVTGNFVVKNTERFHNDLITGEPDNITDIVRDIKSSWDFSTFPLHDTEIPNKDYYWQLQGYMELTGLQSAELIYCLVDTPINLVEDELRRVGWNLGVTSTDSIPRELIVETVCNHIYTVDGLQDFCHQSSFIELEWFNNFRPILEEHRINIFKVDYDKQAIESLYKYLLLARDYLVRASSNIAEKIPQTY